jgi:TRAP-type C4-dicarboxylate transport system permease small subunit
MMKTISKWVSRMTDAIAATLLAAIFLVFLLQIASRYLPKIVTYLDLGWIPAFAAIQPLGWTLELIGILWVWVIFFSCAFVVREQDHVKFDIIYLIV